MVECQSVSRPPIALARLLLNHPVRARKSKILALIPQHSQPDLHGRAFFCPAEEQVLGVINFGSTNVREPQQERGTVRLACGASGPPARSLRVTDARTPPGIHRAGCPLAPQVGSSVLRFAFHACIARLVDVK